MFFLRSWLLKISVSSSHFCLEWTFKKLFFFKQICSESFSLFPIEMNLFEELDGRSVLNEKEKWNFENRIEPDIITMMKLIDLQWKQQKYSCFLRTHVTKIKRFLLVTPQIYFGDPLWVLTLRLGTTSLVQYTLQRTWERLIGWWELLKK